MPNATQEQAWTAFTAAVASNGVGIAALQARAQVQGDPSWWMRETDEGAEWTDTAPLVLSGWTPLYTTPQPAQATQAEVTDERLLEIGREWTKEVGWYEFEVNDFIGCARAILALRPVQVPMTDEQREHFNAGYEAAQRDALVCHLPPNGWHCTRIAGHDGPCAAVEAPEDAALVASAMQRLRDA